jgi:hypothetical protein
MQLVAVRFDFVQPAFAFRRRVDQLRQLRGMQSGNAAARERRATGRGMPEEGRG